MCRIYIYKYTSMQGCCCECTWPWGQVSAKHTWNISISTQGFGPYAQVPRLYDACWWWWWCTATSSPGPFNNHVSISSKPFVSSRTDENGLSIFLSLFFLSICIRYIPLFIFLAHRGRVEETVDYTCVTFKINMLKATGPPLSDRETEREREIN